MTCWANHPLQNKQIVYGYPTLDTTPQQLANYLIALAKTTICKNIPSDEQHPHKTTRLSTHVQYRRLFFPLNLEMHYSIWKYDVETFNGYWLHKNILRKPPRRKDYTHRTDLDTAIQKSAYKK
jgi:hypothetical protein